ncbi:MAG: hypothetical protein ACI81L_003227 [Verrucomicrobiales bacterium]|jgi:uncharacterized protein YcgI (DUF1989 family)
MELGEMREDLVLQPVSGKALPVYKGETIRIIQEVGGQCVDFDCFNLHDYREYMAVGHMRRQGIRVVQGDYALSAPPRSNLMLWIAEMPETCITDLIGSRCSPDLFEAAWDFETHTNCQDTLAESIGEYGLSPDDTHDSFNMWMNTGWDDRGRWDIRRNTGKQGDYVDLLALMDVLAVPIICGSGDITGISNYSLKPIRVQVFESSPETELATEEHLHRFGRLKNQRSLDEYRIQGIKTDRELVRDPDFEPQFPNFPLQFENFEVELTAEDRKDVDRMKAMGKADDDEDAIRSGVFDWFTTFNTEPSPFANKPIMGN